MRQRDVAVFEETLSRFSKEVDCSPNPAIHLSEYRGVTASSKCKKYARDNVSTFPLKKWSISCDNQLLSLLLLALALML